MTDQPGRHGGYYYFMRLFRCKPLRRKKLFPHLIQGIVDRPAHGSFAGHLLICCDLIQREWLPALQAAVFQLVKPVTRRAKAKRFGKNHLLLPWKRVMGSFIPCEQKVSATILLCFVNSKNWFLKMSSLEGLVSYTLFCFLFFNQKGLTFNSWSPLI